jgi:predicted nucleic acid-binding protein
VGFLIDTGVWIDVERGLLTPADVAPLTGNESVYLSPITIAELRFGAEVAKEPGIRQRRLAVLHRIRRKPLVVVDAVTGDIFGSLAAQISAAGQHRYRVQDLWLASQAIQHSYRFLTRNRRDFEDIPGLGLLLYQLPKRLSPGAR